MECLADMARVKGTKPISIKACSEPTNHIKSSEYRNIYEKLGQQEREITDKLQTLKLNQAKLHKKRKSFSWYGHGYYPSSTKEDIDRKLWVIRDLKQSLPEPTDSKKPVHRKNNHLCSPEEILLNEQLVKLHKGRLHGSMNLVEERRLLQKIEKAREEKEKICSDAVPAKQAPYIFMYLHNYKRLMNTSRGYTNQYSEEAIRHCIKVLSNQVEELRMKKMRYEAYRNRLDLEQAATEKEIRISERKLENIKQKKVELASKSQAI
ncbi:hypothetical protein ACET3Z_022874 [Daucus carota]